MVAYEQEYAIDARAELMEWLSLIEKWRYLKELGCKSIPVEIRTTDELFYCGKN